MDEIWEDKIKEYREMVKRDKPELDIELLFRILDIVNESSEVKVAIEPINERGEWTSDAPTYSVRGVTRLEDGRVALTVKSDKHGIEAGDLFLKLKKEFKHGNASKAPVLFVHKEKVTQLTEAYSHALVREQWAGMPFDVVLAVKQQQSS